MVPVANPRSQETSSFYFLLGMLLLVGTQSPCYEEQQSNRQVSKSMIVENGGIRYNDMFQHQRGGFY